MSRIPFQDFLILSESEGEVFISGAWAASDPCLILKHEIKGILALGDWKESPMFTSVTNGYCYANITENEEKIIGFRENLPKVLQFIDSCLNKGNLLICCFYGVCRSALVFCAYLMVRYRIKADKAFVIVKKGRKCADLSFAALKLLMELEDSLFPRDKALED